MGSDFWVWEQRMEDYFKSQHLWRFIRGGTFVRPVEAIAGQPTAAELQALMDWDESNLQVQGIFWLLDLTNALSPLRHQHYWDLGQPQDMIRNPWCFQNSSGYVHCLFYETKCFPQTLILR